MNKVTYKPPIGFQEFAIVYAVLIEVKHTAVSKNAFK